jgi:cytochrome c-type biogenesis protein CcmF
VTLLGELALWLATLLAAWTVAAAIVGVAGERGAFAESGARAALVTPAFAALAAVALLAALARTDLSLRYVAEHGTATLARGFRLGALWAGPEGALLGGAAMLALWGAAATAIVRHSAPALAPVIAGVMGTAALAGLAPLALALTPFARIAFGVPDGRGVHPWLLTRAMLVHAPLLVAALAAAVVPAAHGVAALVRREARAAAWAGARGWALAAWTMLTAAMAFGMRAAYVAPGGTEQWMLLPLDSGALVPWLALAALLHALPVGASPRDEWWRVALALAAAAGAVVAALGTQAGSGAGYAAYSYPPAGPVMLSLAALAAALLAASLARRLLARRRGAAPATPLAWRVGAHVAHAGVAVMLVGAVAAGAWRRTADISIAPGDGAASRDPFGAAWRFESTGVSRIGRRDSEVFAVGVVAARDGGRRALVTTERRVYGDVRGAPLYPPVYVPARVSEWRGDASVRLTEIGDSERTSLRVVFHPLARLVWLGAAVAVLGGALGLLPAGAAPREEEGAS